MKHFAAGLFVWMDKYSRWAWWTLALSALALTSVIYTQKPYLSYKDLPFNPVKAEVKAGEIVPLHIIRCNNTDTVQMYTIARTLEDLDSGFQYVLDDSIVRLNPGCHDEISYANKVPSIVPPGRYRILGVSQIQTAFRMVLVGWYSSEFHVVP